MTDRSGTDSRHNNLRYTFMRMMPWHREPRTKRGAAPDPTLSVVWGWLFVLSTCSYLVDYFGLHGYLRWSLILLFMVLRLA